MHNTEHEEIEQLKEIIEEDRKFIGTLREELRQAEETINHLKKKEPYEITLIKLSDIPYPKALTKFIKHNNTIKLRWDNKWSYEVDLDRITSVGKLLGLILHLNSKTWITTRHISEIIEICKKQCGIKVEYL